MVLTIIEILFLIIGIWALIGGKLPQSFLRFLFGKGRYELTHTQTRLFGALIASPLLVVSAALYLMMNFVGTNGIVYGMFFESGYDIFVIILAIIIMRKARQPEPASTEFPSVEMSTVQQQASRRYSVRLLAAVALVVVGCITLVAGSTLITGVLSAISGNGHFIGDFWQDEFPFILTFVVSGLGIFGIVKLIKVLRS